MRGTRLTGIQNSRVECVTVSSTRNATVNEIESINLKSITVLYFVVHTACEMCRSDVYTPVRPVTGSDYTVAYSTGTPPRDRCGGVGNRPEV
jgi:hypothetical protein